MSYFQKANELYSNKNYKKAIAMYKKALEAKENEASSLYNAAVCFIKLNELKKAIFLLESAISKKKESKYFFNLAYCYALLKDDKKALIYFNTAWSLDHTDKECEKAINLIMNKYNKI